MAAPKVEEKVNDQQNKPAKEPKEPKPKGWDLMCDGSKELLYHKYNVCQIKRSKNDNRVMYQANVIQGKDGKPKLDPANPITVFWLKIEPSYIEKHRKQGKKDDRTDLTFLENNIAYGISWEVHGDAKNNEFKLIFVALKERPAILKIDPKDGLPKCYGKAKDDKGNLVDAVLTSMYVHTKENWVGLPTVNYILLTGNRLDNGEEIVDRITKY